MNTYFFLDVDMSDGGVRRHLVMPSGEQSYTTFPLDTSPDTPEMKAYLAWVAEGNTAEEWTGE